MVHCVDETYSVPRALGVAHLMYKIRAIKESGGIIIGEPVETMIPQAGSRSTPYAANYMKDEPGWRILVRRPVNER